MSKEQIFIILVGLALIFNAVSDLNTRQVYIMAFAAPAVAGLLMAQIPLLSLIAIPVMFIPDFKSKGDIIALLLVISASAQLAIPIIALGCLAILVAFLVTKKKELPAVPFIAGAYIIVHIVNLFL